MILEIRRYSFGDRAGVFSCLPHSVDSVDWLQAYRIMYRAALVNITLAKYAERFNVRHH